MTIQHNHIASTHIAPARMNNKIKMTALITLLSTVLLLNGCGQAGASKADGETAQNEEQKVIPIPVEVSILVKYIDKFEIIRV